MSSLNVFSNTLSLLTDNVSQVTANQKIIITTINSASYTVLSIDEIVIVNYTTTGVCTLTLPLVSTMTSVKRKITIIDGGGNASNNNIIINASGSDTIIGNASLSINTDNSSVALFGVSGKWYLV